MTPEYLIAAGYCVKCDNGRLLTLKFPFCSFCSRKLGFVKESSTATVENVGVKHDQDKLRFSLIPTYPLEKLAEVYTIGAKKYGDDNYLKGMDWRRVMDALHRHMQAWSAGEVNDPQDGQHHLSSVAWCAFTLMMYEKYNLGTDNRWKQEPTVG